MALVGAETASSLVGQSKNAKAQANWQEKTFEANKTLADADAVRKYVALQSRQQQEHAAAGQAIERASLEAIAARGTARVSAGESGVAGNSVTALDQEFRRSMDTFASRKIASQAYLDSQFASEYDAVRAGQEADINAGVGDRIQGPDYLNTIIRGVSKAWEIGYTTQNNKKPKP